MCTDLVLIFNNAELSSAQYTFISDFTFTEFIFYTADFFVSQMNLVSKIK